MLLTFLVIFLPLLEIAGFVVIGGEIGLGYSLLWVITAFFAGFYCLTTMSRSTFRRAKQEVDKDVYPLQQMFDALCILIGSFLLIIPGFVGDFLALVFLIPIFRNGVFLFLKSQHESVLKEFTKNAETYSHWYSEKTPEGDIVEGEFTVVKRTEEPHKKIPDHHEPGI